MKTSVTKQTATSTTDNPFQTITDSLTKYKKHVALFGASAMVAPLFAPLQEVQAEEKGKTNQTQPVIHSNPFLQSIITPATKIAEKNDLYASVMLAQAILESGWGQSTLASAPNYNLFGIKGDYKGQSVNTPTLEDNGNQEYYQINDDFRKYPSYTESLEDYAQLIRTGPSWDPLYYSGAWKSNAKSYQEATQALTGRYATDTAYGTKLNRVIEANGLAAYDTPSSYQGNQSPQPGAGTYTVKKGDTLYRIATAHGLTVEALMAMNQLKSSIIQPGMILAVSKQQSVPSKPAETPSQGNVGSGTYAVRAGDTLWSISQKFGTTPDALKKLNGLSNDMLQIGQVLRTGTQQSNSPSQKPTENPSQSGTTQATYTVQAGDTLWSISQKLKTTPDAIKKLNGFSSDVIHPGQVLKTSSQQGSIPSQNPTPSAPTANSVTVQAGDTLYGIARKLGVSVEVLKSVNNLSSEIIQPGQVLVASRTVQTTPSTPSTVAKRTYVVKKGDTLYAIARAHGQTVEQMRAANGLSSDLIFVGQELVVGAVAKPSTPIVANTYKVQQGDTLYSIAKKNNVTVTRLLELNQINSSLIQPGQSLRVR